LISNLTRISKPVLLIGETGTGKSSIFKEFLMAPEMLEKWEPSQYTMSATTKA
jgi:guanylate kinase